MKVAKPLYGNVFVIRLKKGDNYKITTKVTMYFQMSEMVRFDDSDEIYLIHDKERTLSIELRKNNKIVGTIDFSSGRILKFDTSEFCWGQSKRKHIEIFNLVPNGSSCGSDTFKSARKAKSKNEIKF